MNTGITSDVLADKDSCNIQMSIRIHVHVDLGFLYILLGIAETGIVYSMNERYNVIE